MWESRDANCSNKGFLNPICKSVLSMVSDPKRLIGSIRNHDDLARHLDNRGSVGSTVVA